MRKMMTARERCQMQDVAKAADHMVHVTQALSHLARYGATDELRRAAQQWDDTASALLDSINDYELEKGTY